MNRRGRDKDSRLKFLLGLSLERAGLAIVNDEYVSSDCVYDWAAELLATIETSPSDERNFYLKGEAAFNSASFMEKSSLAGKALDDKGKAYRKWRYHHLVRLGGDVIRAGLSLYPKATVLGAFLNLREKMTDKPDESLSSC